MTKSDNNPPNHCPSKARATLNANQYSQLVDSDLAKLVWSERKKARALRQLEFHINNCPTCWRAAA